MTDTAGITQGLAVFGPDGFTGPAHNPAGDAPQSPPRPPLHLGPVLIGAGVAYGLWRARRRGAA